MAKGKPVSAASTDELLRALMEASGLTDYAISKRAGLAPSQIGRFKKGERGVTTDTADKIFRALGYDWPPPVAPLPPSDGEE